VSGSILLSIPNDLFLPQLNNTPPSDTPGWSNGFFDASLFLARPDIQSQSIPVQMAMLRTNQSYAGLMSFQNNFQSAISAAITSATNMINSVQNSGAHVLTTINELVPASAGLGGVPVVFQSVDYDNGGFLRNSNTIVINQGGSYLVSGDLFWGSTSALANLGYTLMLNGSTVLGTETLSSVLTDPQTEVFSLTYNFNTGDVLQLFAFSSENVELQPGTDLTVNAIPGASNNLPESGGGSSSTTDLLARTLIADAILVKGQCVQIDSSGRVTPVLPTLVAYPLSTTQFNIPYVDGVTLAAAGIGDSVQVATAYGSVYEIPGIVLTPGGIVYVAANGVLTQNYTSVIASCAWTICVGKAVAVDSILFQPHLPYPRWDEGTFTDPLPE
jgi:hypothetical protein